MKDKLLVKNYVDVDIGKKSLECLRLFSSYRMERLKTSTHELNHFLKWIKPEDTVAFEAGNQAFRLVRLLKSRTKAQVLVLNPGDLAMIYRTLNKTTKKDTLELTRLVTRIYMDELPEIPFPSEHKENARRLYTEQTS